MFKFTRKPQADGIYTVTREGENLGTVARVGYGKTWVAYGPEEAISGPRYAFASREEAASALRHYSLGAFFALTPSVEYDDED